MNTPLEDVLRSKTARNTSAGVVAGLFSLRAVSEGKYQEWYDHLTAATKTTKQHPHTIWMHLPSAIQRLFLVSGLDRAASQVETTSFFEGLDLLRKWHEVEADRKNSIASDRVKSDFSRKTSSPNGIISGNSCVLPIDLGTSNAGKTHHRILGLIHAFPTSSACIGISFAGIFWAWFFSPFGWLPVVVLCAVLAMMILADIKKAKLSFRVIGMFVFAISFLSEGVVHDVYFDSKPTAQCSDGSYSYSEHRSGTCSWHHGVEIWAPTLHHWWQSLVAD